MSNHSGSYMLNEVINLLYPHSIDWKNHLPVVNRAKAQPVAFDWMEPLRAECRHFLVGGNGPRWKKPMKFLNLVLAVDDTPGLV
ncbi:MAG: hypothetical protein HY673_10080 [Chloroflexi bacterium]|nr:hypothetical protein [Chloroflexota bacterium]